MRRPTILILLLTLVLAGAPAAPAGARAKPRLHAFDDCSQLVRYGSRHLRRMRPASRVPPEPMPAPAPGPPGAEGTPAPVAAPGAGGEDFSPTNVQEAGVDEPDTVKTDGRHLFALSSGVLRVVDVSGGQPALVASLRVGEGYGHRMLLRGDRLLVLSEGFGPVAMPAQEPPAMPPAFYRPGARLALVDVGDPARPRLLRSLDVDSGLVAARMTGSTARIVLAATPEAVAQDGARRRASAWLPSGTFTNARTDRRRSRRLVGCRAVRRPRAFSGLDTLTVLTVDLEKSLDPVDADGVMASGETVYASSGELFVATQRYADQAPAGQDPRSGVTTAIHRFAIEDAATTRYRGSGRVPGYLLNQFSMSERRGVLRVATTDRPAWWSGDGRESESFVTTLALRDGGLERLGQVGGLGRGERIYAVRFLDAVGYVVTFRETDPLYAVDLSDAAAPRVRGELKVRGYSAYLHPAGEDRLIGVGQDATEQGRRLGTQVSLFDVSDLDRPRLLQRAALGGDSSSEAEYDHHAFLWWPKARLAVLPVSIWETSDGPGATVVAGQGFTGAIGFTVADEGVHEAGRITHPVREGYTPPISRSLVVRDRLYTLSDAGLGVSRLDGLAPEGFVAFD